MPKILTYNSPPGFEKKLPKDNPFRAYYEWFNSQEKYKKFFILTLLLIVTATPYIVNNFLETRQRAQSPEDTVMGANQEPSFHSNELLVKVKKEARGKIRENVTNTGIASINKLNLGKDPKAKYDFKVKGFEKVAKIGKNSNADHELFDWYLLTLDAPNLIASGKLDDASNIIDTNPSNSNSKRFKGGASQSIAVLQGLIKDLKKDPDIAAIDLNYVVSALQEAIPSAVPTSADTPTPSAPVSPTSIPSPTPAGNNPNDPYYSSSGSWGQSYDDLWGIKKINSTMAWTQTTGSANIIVAGIDTGVDRNHEDLQGQMWVNTAETPNNGIDDDGNGYVDDYYGCNFISMVNNICSDPMDDNGHGTHTVGTIAAVGNNGVGVVGVNWTSKIMALKFLNSGGSGYLSDGVKALQYAADMGAKVSSNSWGGGGTSQMMDDAVKYEHDKGMVAVFAAGNANGDALNFNPASADDAITVAASDSNDVKASFSNWGEKIDVAAPGVDILSIRASNNPMCTSARTVGTNYCRVSGTSMATPHVAGLAALLLAKNPSLNNEEIRQILRNGADDLGTPGKDASYGYGRINVTGSINLATTHPLTPYITSPRSRTIASGANFQISGSVPGPNFANYKIEVGFGRSPTSWTNVANSTNQVVNGVLATVDTAKLKDGLSIFRLNATDTAGKSYQFQVHDVEVDNFDAEISSPGGLVSQGIIGVFGSAQAKNGLVLANYKLEWGDGQSPASWSTTGINLVNGGTQPINSGKLGTWDTAGFADGQIKSLRLTVTASSGVSTQYQMTLRVDKDLIPGWPKGLDFSNCATESLSCTATPVLADLDNNGSKEIIILSSNKVYVFNKDGSSFAPFPITIPQVDYKEFFDGPANVVDLDGDGKKEIIANAIVTRYTAYVTSGTRIHIIKSDGTLYPGWPRPKTGQSAYSIGAAVADLNQDGIKEIISLQSKTLHAYQLNGSEITGFPRTINIPETGLFEDISINDLDNDGRPEISFAQNQKVFLVDNQGNLLTGWPFTASQYDSKTVYFETISASGDVDGDGQKEIVILGNVGGCGGCKALAYALKKDGSLVSGWPIYVGYIYNGGGVYNTPSLADIDQDGKDEVLTGTATLTMIDDGVAKTLGGMPAYQPAIGDVNGDGLFEFSSVKLGGGELRFFNEKAVKIWERILGTGVYFDSPGMTADLDNDGKMEFCVAQSYYNGLGGVNIYLWELPLAGSGKAQYEWPMFSHDPQRTGRLVVGPQAPTPTFGPTSTPQPTPTPTRIPTPTPFSTPTPTPVPGDTIAPSVSVTFPLSGAILARNKAITITASASDNVGISKVEFLVNGVLTCTDTATPFACSWKVPGRPSANYTISAKAYDLSNNSSIGFVNVKSSK